MSQPSPQYKAEYYRQHRSKIIAQNERNRLRRQYGITSADVEAMRERQNNRCAICRREPENNLHIDHDHSSQRVRGLLCGSCNRALGLFGDSVESLQRAIEYLRR